jgi:hypothetical protein
MRSETALGDEAGTEVIFLEVASDRPMISSDLNHSACELKLTAHNINNENTAKTKRCSINALLMN